MANEWMKRGISLYFDNANPKLSLNERFGCAWRDPYNDKLLSGTTIWGHREYFRRIYKHLSALEKQGVPYPLNFTIHMTNTQVLPMNTWATAHLDLEQCAWTGNPETDEPELTIPDSHKEGFQYPWPADYVRAVFLGGQTGTRPLALFAVAGYEGKFVAHFTPEIGLREWGMRFVHDVQTDTMMWHPCFARAREYDKALREFGYGDDKRARHHSYWEEKPILTVSDPDIKWLALENVKPTSIDAKGMVLLQSYARKENQKVKLTIPGAKVIEDVETGEEIKLDKNGTTEVVLKDIFGTRMFRWM